MLTEYNEHDRDALVEDALASPEEENINEEEEVVDNNEEEEVVDNNEEKIIDEQNEEGAEKEEGETEEEEEEEEEEETEEEEPEEELPKEIPVQYTDSEGNMYNENVPVEELPAIMSVAKEGLKALDYVQQVTPIMEAFNKSKILQDIAYYISQGNSDEDIKKGLPQLWAKDTKTEDKPEFDTMEEEVAYYVSRAIDDKLNPLQSKVKETEEMARRISEEKSTSAIMNNNRNVIVNALTSQGFEMDKVTELEVQAINETFMDIYPGISMERMQLSSKQANVLVRNALSDKGLKRVVKKNKVKTMAKQSKATRSMPGSSQRAKARNTKYVPRGVPTSEAERARKVDEIFENI